MQPEATLLEGVQWKWGPGSAKLAMKLLRNGGFWRSCFQMIRAEGGLQLPSISLPSS